MNIRKARLLFFLQIGKKSVTGYVIIVTTKSIPPLDSVQAHNLPVCAYIVPVIIGNKQHLRNEVNA